ncbi:MAG: hypothetical protein JWM27_199 [Gemmatimonadetes bacterium]|nr:hypothetical protein [Gemmatimonadota bacterium]
MQAGTLQCPTCGAAALSDATWCAYCKARLATVACPSCFGMVFAGTRFCPHCGAGAERAAADGNAPARPCPRCKEPLTAVRVGNAPVGECPRCGGLWLDAETFAHVTTEREAQAAVLASVGGSGVPGLATPDERVRYGPCPQCGKVMNRINFARYSGVVVDVCKGHGTWFDADELRRVVEFIRSGGLDLAREKERQALIEERRRLAAHALGPDGGAVPAASPYHLDRDERPTGMLAEITVTQLMGGLWDTLRKSVGF